MEESLKARIEERDRHTCKMCGNRFVGLNVYQFFNDESSVEDDNFITLCKSCSMNPDMGSKQYKKAVRRNKIILVGDCHGNFLDLDKALEAEEPYDFFLSVGDLGKVTEYGLNALSVGRTRFVKGYAIKGNHDDDADMIANLSLVQNIRGLNVAALNGMLKSRTFLKDMPNNISFKEVMYLSQVKNIDILVTHQPPTGLHDRIGEVALRELLTYTTPKIYISGHVHKYKMQFFGRSFVFSLPMITKGYAVAYFQGSDLRNIEVVLKKGKKVIRV